MREERGVLFLNFLNRNFPIYNILYNILYIVYIFTSKNRHNRHNSATIKSVLLCRYKLLLISSLSLIATIDTIKLLNNKKYRGDIVEHTRKGRVYELYGVFSVSIVAIGFKVLNNNDLYRHNTFNSYCVDCADCVDFAILIRNVYLCRKLHIGGGTFFHWIGVFSKPSRPFIYIREEFLTGPMGDLDRT
jgi:hypothetical protein